MTDAIVCSGNGANKILDPEYAELIIAEFRRQTGWKVDPNTRIHNDLTKFSMRYSEEKRDCVEVVTIFRIAAGI